MRLLDLFCGAGGAAMGYSRAGFTEIVGVDIKPQPRYPFAFVEGDALEYVVNGWRGFDAIHASPPCQGYSRLRHLPWLKGREYPMLLDVTRDMLNNGIGLPWVIENVEDAPMPYSVVLCGLSFGLPLYRHRRFGSSHFLWQPAHHQHRHTIAAGRASMATRYAGTAGVTGVVKEIAGSLAGHATGALATGRLIGIDWMRREELAQAIPPAYTEWIGRQLLAALAPPSTVGRAE